MWLAAQLRFTILLNRKLWAQLALPCPLSSAQFPKVSWGLEAMASRAIWFYPRLLLQSYLTYIPTYNTVSGCRVELGQYAPIIKIRSFLLLEQWKNYEKESTYHIVKIQSCFLMVVQCYSIVYRGRHKLCMNICLVVKVNKGNQDGWRTFRNIRNSHSIYTVSSYVWLFSFPQ